MLSDKQLQRVSPVPLLRVPGRRVRETWEEHRQRRGVVPVLLGNREASSIVLSEAGRCGGSVDQVINEALHLDLDAWMAERRGSRPEHWDVKAIDRPWDGVCRRLTPFVPAYNHRGDPLDEVFFALVPAEEPWQVPAHLRSAGIGDLPRAAVQTALWHRWYERHGAEVITIADGAVELIVERPLPNMQIASEVAVEQFTYSPDIIHYGMATLGNLAAALTTNRLWYFWWAIDGPPPK